MAAVSCAARRETCSTYNAALAHHTMRKVTPRVAHRREPPHRPAPPRPARARNEPKWPNAGRLLAVWTGRVTGPRTSRHEEANDMSGAARPPEGRVRL